MASDDSWAVALDDHVGVERHLAERAELVGIGEVGVRLPFAVSGVDDERRDDGNVGTAHVEDVGAEGGQGSPARRPGEYPGQVEHPQTVERSGR